MRLIKGRSFYKEPWYGSYRSMMDRCYRKESANYKFYGGRGICVCREWHNIEEFEKWANESGFSPGMSLDRKDTNGNYCPENCRWATAKEQANNRRNTVYLEYNGERKTITEWAELLGINRSTLNNRICRGWSAEKALSRRNYFEKMRAVIENEPTIDPETLPIVQELRNELERVTRERDAAVSEIQSIIAYGLHLPNTCPFCKNEQCKMRGGTEPCIPKWRGIQEVQEDEQL